MKISQNLIACAQCQESFQFFFSFLQFTLRSFSGLESFSTFPLAEISDQPLEGNPVVYATWLLGFEGCGDKPRTNSIHSGYLLKEPGFGVFFGCFVSCYCRRHRHSKVFGQGWGSSSVVMKKELQRVWQISKSTQTCHYEKSSDSAFMWSLFFFFMFWQHSPWVGYTSACLINSLVMRTWETILFLPSGQI